MFCNKCGHTIVGNERFCPKCGVKVSKRDFGKFKSYLKNSILFVSIFILSISVFGAVTDDYDYALLPSLAATILAVFLWKKISKRFNI